MFEMLDLLVLPDRATVLFATNSDPVTAQAMLAPFVVRYRALASDPDQSDDDRDRFNRAANLLQRHCDVYADMMAVKPLAACHQ